jgi:uncharacterized protein (UPF0333 family)
MRELKTEEEFNRNQVELQFKHYMINMILLFIFFGIIMYVLIDVITDIQTSKMIKQNLRIRFK